MISEIETLISTLLILYLPILDQGLKITLSLSITKLICSTLTFTLKYIITFFTFIKRYISKSYIRIPNDNTIYNGLLYYITTKYKDNICGYQMKINYDEMIYNIKELNKSYITDIFVHNGKSYKMMIGLVSDSNTSINTNTNKDDKKTIIGENDNIEISAYCNIDILKEYVKYITHFIDKEYINTDNNTLLIYKIMKKGNKDDKQISWKEYVIKTNKNLNNTIVPKEIRESFLQDIQNFINSEQYYIKKGLPYKRGYILYGPPGCGKTSIIKAIAKHYNIPIFIIDLNIVKDNASLTKIANEINSLCAHRKLHIVLFEDVDRTKIFSESRYYSSISEDCVLNIIDGIEENYGRLTFLTTNNISKITNMEGLLRPGRIDAQINISYCTIDQIGGFFKLHFDNYDESQTLKINKNVCITPATLTHMILTLKNVTNIIKVLNQFVNFKKSTLEELLPEVTFSENDNSEDNNNVPNVDLNNNIDIIGQEDDSEDDDEDDSSPDKRSYKNKKYDSMYCAFLKKKADYDTWKKCTDQQDKKYKLLQQKKEISLEIEKINLDNYKNGYNVIPLEQLNKDNYDDIKKYVYRRSKIDYKKLKNDVKN